MRFSCAGDNRSYNKGKKGDDCVWKIERIWEAEPGKKRPCAAVLGGQARHGNPPQFARTASLLYCAGHSGFFLGIRELKKKGASPESNPRADAEAGAGNGKIKTFLAEAARRQRRSRESRQYREKRTKCRRWLWIFCPSGKQNSWRTL